jgi:RimJ/RimL family protein N-acetyltransferase
MPVKDYAETPDEARRSAIDIYLETERLVLRRFTEADVDHLVELDSDPAVMRFLTGGKPTPREVVQHEVLPTVLGDYDRYPGRGRWAAVDRATGAFLGWFALQPPDQSRAEEVELGYRLRKSAWGTGYATEGARALIRKAFTELGVERVYAETMAVNLASRRVLERVGMRLVRTFHLTWDDPIDGTEHGEVEYELRRADPAGAEPR